MAESTKKADSPVTYPDMLSSSDCDCTFGASINANVYPNNTYGIATRAYVDSSIEKHNCSDGVHEAALSGFVSEINGLRPENHSLSLSSLRATSPYGEILSEIRSDGSGILSGEEIRYATTKEMESSISVIVDEKIAPMELSSAKWNSATSTVSAASGGWESTFSTVSAASASWNGGGDAKIKADSVYATVSSCSAEWEGRQEQIYVDNDGEDEISPWVDTTPKTDTINRLVTSRGVAEALFTKISTTFPVYVYQGDKKYKVSISDDGAGNISFAIVSAESYPVFTKYQNVTNVNTATSVYGGETYYGKLVADDGCTFSGGWCTMGGVTQTVSADGSIRIPNVSAAISISGLAITHSKLGTFNEVGNVLTLPSDALTGGDGPPYSLYLGSFATSMDNANILLQCSVLKRPYEISYELKDATSTSDVTAVQPGTPYSTQLCADYGYVMELSSCTMGGVPQPIVNGYVSIGSVDGNISIKAIAALSSEAFFDSGATFALTLPSDVRFAASDGTLTLGKSVSADSAFAEITLRGHRNLQTFTVTNALHDCTTSNPATTALETTAYTAQISPLYGYSLSSVSCTMGGVPQTVVGGAISIPHVDGNISIEASAGIASLASYDRSTGALRLPSDTEVAVGDAAALSLALGASDVPQSCSIKFGKTMTWDKSTGTLGASGEVEPIYYSVTNSLVNCTTSNPAVSALSGSSYEATISTTEGCELTSLSCTMGGVPQTVTGNSISIPSVTGDIAVSAGAASSNYLTFTSVSGGSNITFDYWFGSDVEYSKNGGEWTECPEGTTVVLENGGDAVRYRGKDVCTYDDTHFSMTGGAVRGSGSVTSLTDGVGIDKNVKLRGYCYSYMFYDCGLMETAPELPAITLSSSCYACMFTNCSSLTAAPQLPATTMVDGCYAGMFHGCTSLTNAPALPATTLANSCYGGMFYGCTSLTAAPQLPATTANDGCYEYMFAGCLSLVNPPSALPAEALSNTCYQAMFAGCSSLRTPPSISATSIANYCCNYMFSNCYSLTAAPELPSLTATHYCYGYMFQNCSSLTVAPLLPATTLGRYCYYYMFSGCSSLTAAPQLPATTAERYCYSYMFNGCSALLSAPHLPATGLYDFFSEHCYDMMFQNAVHVTSVTMPEDCGYSKGSESLATSHTITITYV